MNGGYKQLVEAAHSLTGIGILDRRDTAGESDIADFLVNNQSALATARRALSEDCHVELVHDATFMDWHSREISVLRDLARALALEMTASVQSGALDRAAMIGIDLFALGNAARRGGLVIDSLVGVAFEEIGLNRLRSLRAQLDVAASIALADAILKMDAARESFDDIVQRDCLWDRVVGLADRGSEGSTPQSSKFEPEEGVGEVDDSLKQAIQELAEMPIEQLRSIERQGDNQMLALWRLLAIEVALNAHRIVTGELPPELDALVPEFIPRLPPDPFTGAPFKYRRMSDGICLYSPGPSGHDHGGRFGGRLEILTGTCDLCLDMHDYGLSCPTLPPSDGLIPRAVSWIRRLIHR